MDQETILDQEAEVDLAQRVCQVWEVDLVVHLHIHTVLMDQQVEVEVEVDQQVEAEVDQVLHLVTFHTTLL